MNFWGFLISMTLVVLAAAFSYTQGHDDGYEEGVAHGRVQEALRQNKERGQ